MSRRDPFKPATAGEPGDMPTVALIRLAGRRPEPAPFRTARARTVVEAEWRRTLRRRSARRAAWLLVAATAAVLAMAVLLRTLPAEPGRAPDAAPPSLATVTRAVGTVRITLQGSPARPISAVDQVTAGAVVETGPGGRAAFQLRNRASLRVDTGSRLVFETASRIALAQGRVYVDRIGTTPDDEGLEIATGPGIVRDIGTQFEVTASSSAVQLRVREGIVRIDGPRVSASLGRAESLRIDASGRLERGSISTHGPEWTWTESLSPPFAIEGASLESFLHWVGRERGLSWRFRDEATARQAKTIVLHGSIEGLTPSEALDAVLPTSGMSHQLRGGQLVIALASQ